METHQIQEGYLPFLGYRTYYRIVKPKEESAEKSALLLLHGGPGSTHNYFEVLDGLADTGRAVISYDCIGCGNSYVEGRPDLWVMDTWVRELENLISGLHLTRYHLLGQSFGGMLALSCLLDKKPQGAVSVILSSTLSASWLWGHEQHRRIRFLPESCQEAIWRAEKTGDFTAPDVQEATRIFMERYCAGEPDANTPECVRREKKTGTESYVTAWGPNEFTPTGTLKDFDVTARLPEIKIPALVISGTNDLCSPLIAKTMYDGIPDSRWELFDGARHMCFVEDTPKYMALLTRWMAEHDAK